MDLPPGTTAVPYTDELALVVTADEGKLEASAEVATEAVRTWMHQNKLDLASEKTEAVFISSCMNIYTKDEESEETAGKGAKNNSHENSELLQDSLD
ncbi:hypothetical protein J6590_044653 [Homalodisca vitripennis]|nr:hypothetical protein J6590_044653 [Homalodisca vitripennis]